MPVNRRSLGVTDAYRRRMLEIRRKGEQMARQTWGDVDPEDLAGTFKVKPLANGVGVLQRTGVYLSQAYVQAFIKSEIGKDVLIPTPQGFSGDSFDDVKLRFALWRPVVLVRQLLEQGVDMPEAMRRGRDTLLRSVSLATDGAVRDSLQKLYDRQPEIVGWKRAVKGTCDICMGAADGSTLPPGTPLDIHPNCECVSEAVLRPESSKAAGQAISDQIGRWGNVDATDAQLAEAAKTWEQNMDAAVSLSPEARQLLTDAIRANEGSPEFQALIDKYAKGNDVVVLLDTKAVKANDLLSFEVAEGRASARRLADTTFVSDAEALAARGVLGARATETYAGILRHEFSHSLWDAIPGTMRTEFTRRLKSVNVTDFTQYNAAKSSPVEAFCEAVRVISAPEFKAADYSPAFREMAKWLKASL